MSSMTDKPSREDVARVAGEPVAWLITQVAGDHKGTAVHGITLDKDDTGCAGDYWTGNKPLYTEAQLLAMYAAGADAMRERADDAWSDAIQSDCEHGVKLLSEKSVMTLRNEYQELARLGETIRALPITTNTEGERG